MFSKISKLGIVLNKTELKNINGSRTRNRCKIELDCPGGFYWNSLLCTCEMIEF